MLTLQRLLVDFCPCTWTVIRSPRPRSGLRMLQSLELLIGARCSGSGQVDHNSLFCSCGRRLIRFSIQGIHIAWNQMIVHPSRFTVANMASLESRHWHSLNKFKDARALPSSCSAHGRVRCYFPQWIICSLAQCRFLMLLGGFQFQGLQKCCLFDAQSFGPCKCGISSREQRFQRRGAGSKDFFGYIDQRSKRTNQASKTVPWSTGFNSGRKPMPSVPSEFDSRLVIFFARVLSVFCSSGASLEESAITSSIWRFIPNPSGGYFRLCSCLEFCRKTFRKNMSVEKFYGKFRGKKVKILKVQLFVRQEFLFWN